MTTATRRPRRIAADEAHSWARNLRLNNPIAKLVLSMLTLYVDSDGCCFVSIPVLSEDVELSPQTVRKRLEWLEEVGAIARIPQWIDNRGHRNDESRGRRTSDLIRLKFDDDERLEERARAVQDKRADPIQQIGSNSDADPIHGIGSNEGGDSAGTPLGLRRPYDSVEGLISEPEPEPESPKAPNGGERASSSIEEGEPEHFGPAWKGWPGHEVMRRDLALEEFRKLTPAQQRLCRAAVPQFLKMQQHLKRDHTPNFHIWIRSGGFNEFPTAVLEEGSASSPGQTSFDVASREGKAIKALFSFARVPLFEYRGKVIYLLPVTAQVLAFEDHLPPADRWVLIETSPQLAAWSAFLSAHIHTRRTDLGRSFRAPWPWPPRKDGSIGQADDSGEAA